MRGRLGSLILLAPLTFLPGTLKGQAGKSPDAAQPDMHSAPGEDSIRLSSVETVLYEFTPTLIDWTPQQVHDFPSLHKLRPAASQDQLLMILDRAGKTGAVAFRDFPRISCDEAVDSTAGTPPKTKHQDFRYIVLPRPAGNVHLFEEYRTDLAGNPPEKLKLGSLFMITSGFASTWLYLSPDERNDSRFRYFGTQTIRNRQCHVVGFAQDPQRAHNLGEFSLEGKSATILLQGLAWIDSESSQILRVMTWLLAPREDVDLNSEISTVDFYAVQPSGSERILWLPRDVKVWARYRGLAVHNTHMNRGALNGEEYDLYRWQDVRNTHHYSSFKLFRVESSIKP